MAFLFFLTAALPFIFCYAYPHFARNCLYLSEVRDLDEKQMPIGVTAECGF